MATTRASEVGAFVERTRAGDAYELHNELFRELVANFTKRGWHRAVEAHRRACLRVGSRDAWVRGFHARAIAWWEIQEGLRSGRVTRASLSRRPLWR